MAIARLTREADDQRLARPPRPWVLLAIAVAGLVAAATSFALALNSDHVPEPGAAPTELETQVTQEVGQRVAHDRPAAKRSTHFGTLRNQVGLHLIVCLLCQHIDVKPSEAQ